jgi:hypothetical protein
MADQEKMANDAALYTEAGTLDELEHWRSESKRRAHKCDELEAELKRWRTDAQAYANVALSEENDRLIDALEKIVSWADAYPLKVFPEPDFKKADELLEAGGMSLDGISASNMRHVVRGVGNIAREALGRGVLDKR